MGVETDPAEGMLLFDDMNVIEAGSDGIYLTCLYNFAQPLIRYHLSDRLVLQPPKADSRHPFTCATGLLGRNEDMLWFENCRRHKLSSTQSCYRIPNPLKGNALQNFFMSMCVKWC